MTGLFKVDLSIEQKIFEARINELPSGQEAELVGRTLRLLRDVFGNNREPLPAPEINNDNYVLHASGYTSKSREELQAYLKDNGRFATVRIEVYKPSTPSELYKA